MKKVTFTKYIRAIYIKPDGGETYATNYNSMPIPKKEGTGIDEECSGTFLDWGLDTDERMGSWTVAIVQLEDGSIDYIHPVSSKMKFIHDFKNVNPDESPTMNDFLTALNSASNVHSIIFYNTVAEYQATIRYHEDSLLPDDFNVVEDNGKNIIDFLITG